MKRREMLDKLDNIEYAKKIAEIMELTLAVAENIRILGGKEEIDLADTYIYTLCREYIYKWLESEV